jgi:hypothetical protein
MSPTRQQASGIDANGRARRVGTKVTGLAAIGLLPHGRGVHGVPSATPRQAQVPMVHLGHVAQASNHRGTRGGGGRQPPPRNPRRGAAPQSVHGMGGGGGQGAGARGGHRRRCGRARGHRGQVIGHDHPPGRTPHHHPGEPHQGGADLHLAPAAPAQQVVCAHHIPVHGGGCAGGATLPGPPLGPGATCVTCGGLGAPPDPSTAPNALADALADAKPFCLPLPLGLGLTFTLAPAATATIEAVAICSGAAGALAPASVARGGGGGGQQGGAGHVPDPGRCKRGQAPSSDEPRTAGNGPRAVRQGSVGPQRAQGCWEVLATTSSSGVGHNGTRTLYHGPPMAGSATGVHHTLTRCTSANDPLPAPLPRSGHPI